MLGDVQKNWDGIGSRFGLCIERGKDVVAGIVKNSAMGNRNVNNSILQFTGLLGQKMEEGRANLLQAWESLNRNHHNTRMPMFASISASSGNTSAPWEPTPLFQLAMSTEQVSKRLDGVPVYTVSNSANEFVLVSDINSQKSLGIFCFRQEDAEALLSQVYILRISALKLLWVLSLG